MAMQLLAPARPEGSPWMLDSRCNPAEPLRPRGVWATGLTKTAAEAVRDWLEVHGHAACRVSYAIGEGFTVSE